MKSLKKAWIAPLLLSAFLFSCGNPGSNQNSSTEEALSGDSLSLSVYETASIPERFASHKATSSDESVAKIVGEKILALSSGEATVRFDGISEVLSVKVSDSGDVPFLSLGLSSLSLFAGDTYSLSPSLTYKGKTAEASFGYAISDSSIATISSNGAISALREGRADITVTASYYGLEADEHPFLSSSLSLEVHASSSALLAAEATTLYTLDCVLNENAFSSETTLTGVYGDASGSSDLFKKSLTWVISDPSVLSVSGSKVKALKKGKAEVYATFEGGETNHLNFVVDKPYYEVSSSDFYDSYSKALDLDYSSFLKGGDSKAVAIYDSAEPDKNILKSDGSLDFAELGERTWMVEGETYSYKIPVTSVSKIITTSTELTSMLLYGSEKKTSDYGYMSMKGYFVLGNDIDMNGGALRAILGPNNGATSLEDSGFFGTFDGRGHTIKNAAVSANNGGLFGTLANGSVIKNLALEDIEIKGASGALASYLGGAIENVYVKGEISYAKGTSSLRSSLLANRIDASSSIKNVVVEYTNPSAKTPFASAIGYLDGEASENCFSNVYVIGTEDRVFSTSASGSYLNFSSSKNGQYADYASFKAGASLTSFGENWAFLDSGISFHN